MTELKRSSKIRVKEIRLEKMEGKPEHNFEVKVNNWKAADKMLKLWQQQMNNCYDRIEFEIIFDDDSTYEGSHDLEANEDINLKDRVNTYIKARAGVEKPPKMSKETWESIQKNFVDESFKELLEKYDV